MVTFMAKKKKEKGEGGEALKEEATLDPNHEGPLFLENALLLQWVMCLLCKYKDLDLNF